MKVLLPLLLVLPIVLGAWVQMESDISPWTPPGWIQLRGKDSQKKLTVYVMMKHDEETRVAFDELLQDIANPKSANYGKWLSIAEVTEAWQSPQQHLDAVTRYIESFGAEHEILINKDGFKVTASINVLEAMLNTEFQTFTKNGVITERVVRPYYLPEELASIVSIVDPLIRFPKAEPNVKMVNAGASGNWTNYCSTEPGCAGLITPEIIKQQYKIAEPTNGKTSIAVAEFQGQNWDSNDLTSFATACKLPTYQVTMGSGTNGNCLTVNSCIESLLDIEYAASITEPSVLVDYYSSTYSLLNWATTVDADPNAPYVHSVSYGNDEVQQTSTNYMFQVNDEFMKVTSRGITIVFASGDQGVWGRSGTSTGQFNPDFPAASPYVFAVGGSDLSTVNVGPETCCRDSGGGFSNTFPQQSWQKTQIATYFSTAGNQLPASNLYNATGRGYPDVSAIFGLNIPYCIRSAGNNVGVAGTSASAPVVASMIALLNDIRIAKGAPTLGYANAFFYGLPATAFNDITTGKNDGGKATGGFPAVKGWDPCTGIGTLNYQVLATLV